MSLSIGARFGPYQVTGSLGAGGMGEVYRARDTKLDRDVALKVLPPEFASDPERLARFEREAKTLASLNHPNIAAIHGIEDAGDAAGSLANRALIMELVEGEDLSQRLARGPVPLDDALPIARQIASALEAAHELGIVHRDLKPANVKLRPDGMAKVLDFGLAKPRAASSAVPGDLLNSPTITSPMTLQGVILGTAAYMSPEQARGQDVDRRADIWAFGCVLYEMLTGRRPFDGPTITDVLASVVKSEADWRALPADTPASVRRLLRRCLTRDRRERLQHIGDARLELAGSSDAESLPVAAAPSTPGARAMAISGWAVALVAVGAVGYLAVRERETPAVRPAYRFSVQPPPAGADPPVMSPDGRHLAYEAGRRIWVRSLDQPAARAVDGTEGGRAPFWSPDSRSIAFFAGESLKRIALAGGPPETLAVIPQGWPHGTWSASGALVIEVTENPAHEGWYLLSPGASAAKKIRAFAADRPINPDKAFPKFLPDGVHFLFTHPVGDVATLQIGSIASDATVSLGPADSRAEFASGHLFYVRHGTLFAQPFDPDRRTVTGDAVAVVDEVDYFAPTGEGSFSVSAEGTLVYRRFQAPTTLRWFDREGRQTGTVLTPDRYTGYAISPDGQRLAVEILDPRRSTTDIWIVDLERNVPTRLTSSPRSELGPMWSPDGTRLAFSADWQGPPNLYLGDASGGEPRVLVPFDRTQQYARSWTPDGLRVLYNKRTEDFARDIWIVDVATGERRPVLATSFDESASTVSPNGQWMAYVSNASGRPEAYLRPFPEGTWQTRLSTDGATQLAWRADGRELFYYEPSGSLMSVSMTPGPSDTARAGRAVRLFQLDPRTVRSVEAAPDGQRFLFNLVDPDAFAQLDEVVVDWTRLLRK